jgi:hypothetical protein
MHHVVPNPNDYLKKIVGYSKSKKKFFEHPFLILIYLTKLLKIDSPL